MSENTLEKAHSWGKKAEDADKGEKYGEAFNFYQHAVQYYLHALKYEPEAKEQEAKASIKGLCDRYLGRINELKMHHLTESKSPTTVKDGAGGGSNSRLLLSSGIKKKPTDITTLEKANQLSKKGADADKEQQYEEALRLYHEATQYYIHALKYEVQSGDKKTSVTFQCDRVLTRAEELKKYLKEKTKESQTIKGTNFKPSSSSSSSLEQNGPNITGKSALEKAIELSKKATDADNDNKYKEAVGLYKEAIHYYLHVLKYEAHGDKAKASIKGQCDKYLMRASQLEMHITNQDSLMVKKKNSGSLPSIKKSSASEPGEKKDSKK